MIKKGLKSEGLLSLVGLALALLRHISKKHILELLQGDYSNGFIAKKSWIRLDLTPQTSPKK